MLYLVCYSYQVKTFVHLDYGKNLNLSQHTECASRFKCTITVTQHLKVHILNIHFMEMYKSKMQTK